MKYFRHILPVIVLLMLTLSAGAQQFPLYSQYIMNGFLINPALAGRDGYTTFNLTVREQWIGMADAPTTYAASFQSRILKNSFISKSTEVKKSIVKPARGGRVGVGGYLFNDNNGIMKRTGAQLSYAYHIPLGSTQDVPNDLSFGLAFTGYQYAINTTGAIYNHDDPYLNSYNRSVFIPDFNFGTCFTTTKYYVGFALTNMFRGSLMASDTGSVNRRELGHYFLTAGVRIPLSSQWKLEPSAFLKSSDMFFNAVQADITTRVYYKDDYWAGISYRTSDALIAMVGLRVDRFYVGYAFDFALSSIKLQTIGSHELTLAVKFGENPRRFKWINSF
jgi:type IX secretion system PorP/SprF family membrane protein